MKSITFKELAIKVLKEEMKPLSAKEIWEIAQFKKYDMELNSSGKTPWLSVGSIIYVDIRDNPDSPFRKTSMRGKFYLKEIIEEDIAEINEKLSEEQKNKKDGIKVEIELHPYLTYFVYMHNKIITKTINHHISNKKNKNLNKWKHPDIVGVYLPNWEPATKDLAKNVSVSGAKFFSYELKLEITLGNLREHFFQAVSNSSWANEGYLVAESISEDPEFLDEFKKLNNAFGIGLIQLSTTDENDSKIIFQAKEKENLDFETMNGLAKINKDFEVFLKDVASEIVRPGHNMKLDKIKDFNELYK